MYDEISVKVILNGEIFRRFAIFDSLIRSRRLRLVLVFAGIMLFFAGVVFTFRHLAEGAGLLAGTLAGVGVFLPIVYLGVFLRSVRLHIFQHGLSEGKHVYTLNLSNQPDGIRVQNDTEQAQYRWGSIYGAYRIRDCICLYIITNRAFLLPDSMIEGGPDKLWNFLCTQLPPEKLRDARGVWI